MRVPLSWLEELVPLNLSVAALAERLTVSGIEVEAVESFGFLSEKVRVGRVSACVPLPKKPKVKRVTVEVGKAGSVQVVSGAPNIDASSVGKSVAIALPGAIIYDLRSDPPRLREVKAATLYGEQSEGVLCSEAELGLSGKSSEVLVLGAGEPGLPLAKAITASPDSSADTVLTLAILPNIARCMSMAGVANEVALLTHAQASPVTPKTQLTFSAGKLEPRIAEPAACSAFRTVALSGISVQPSPRWVQRRLIALGIEPVNNVVDASSYVMFELGQPTHMYDFERLPDPKLGVRWSRKGERFLPLGAAAPEAALTLEEGLLVVTSRETPVALAGVIGGAETRIREGTTKVLLESACFDLFAVRRGQRRTGIHTDASARFSRAVSPDLGPVAAARVIDLLRETCPQLKVEDTGVWMAQKTAPREVQLDVGPMNAALGTSFSPTLAAELLGRAFAVRVAGDRLTVQVPPGRADITLPADLMEEVVRIAGYDTVPATMPIEPIPLHPPAPGLAERERLVDALVGCGLQEALTYSLTDPKLEQALGGSDSVPYVTLQNPVSVDRRVLRRTLLGGLLQAVVTNQRHRAAQKFFTVGPVFLPEGGDAKTGLPAEPLRVALALSGDSEAASVHNPSPRKVDFFDLSSVLSRALGSLGIFGVRFEKGEHPWFHPGICARVRGADTLYGTCGALHPAAATRFGLEVPTFFAELDLDALLADAKLVRPVAPIPRFPSIELDIALIVDDSRPAQDLLDLARGKSGELIEAVTVFDLYRGDQVPSGKKAIGLRLTFRGRERTLTMEEAVAAREALVGRFAQSFGATLRK